MNTIPRPGEPEPGQPPELMVCQINEGHDTLYLHLHNTRAALADSDFTPAELRWIASHIEKAKANEQRQHPSTTLPH